MSTALERYYSSMDNVVIRDINGNPSIFVKHYKQKSSDFDSSLPNHYHPAFIYGKDSEENDIVDDAVLIGKYANCSLSSGGIGYSIPGMPIQQQITRDYINGSNNKIPITNSNMTIGALSIYDYGLLVLTAHQLKIKGVLGYDCTGLDLSCGIAPWVINTAAYRNIYHLYPTNGYTVGDQRAFQGDVYECIKAHTLEENDFTSILPNRSPAYWKKIKHMGVTPCEYYEPSISSPGIPGVLNALSGSGPISQYFNNDLWRETDFCGWALLRGIRIYNGEIQILPNEYASNPLIDMSTTNLWRAILPGDTSDTYSLVEPGTSGTIHIHHKANAPLTYVNRELETTDYYNSEAQGEGVQFDITGKAIPCILYELGIAPLNSTPVVQGWKGFRVRRAGYYNYLACGYPRPSNSPKRELYGYPSGESSFNLCDNEWQSSAMTAPAKNDYARLRARMPAST